MESVSRVIRNTSVSELRKYFDQKLDGGGTFVDWQGNGTTVARRLLKTFSKANSQYLSVITMDFDRVSEMTDEPGQQALASVLQGQNEWHSLGNAYDRALWAFIAEPTKFRRAEEVSFAENNRKGRRWAGFSGPSNLAVSYEPEHRQEFEEGVRGMFKTEHAQLELYERVRFGLQGEEQHLTQAVIYREGLPSGILEFVNGELSLRSHRPVLEAVITYDASNGAIEVMGQDSKFRPRLARLFAQAILRKQILGLFLPLRQYDLSSLVFSRKFPTDPKDGISHVQVMNLALRHRDIPNADFVINTRQKCELTPHEFSEKGLGDLRIFENSGLEIFQATLCIHFRPDRNNRLGKVINVKLSLPNGCDLKGKTEKERLICEKYLPRWGLVKDA